MNVCVGVCVYGGGVYVLKINGSLGLIHVGDVLCKVQSNLMSYNESVCVFVYLFACLCLGLVTAMAFFMFSTHVLSSARSS